MDGHQVHERLLLVVLVYISVMHDGHDLLVVLRLQIEYVEQQAE